jgi:carbon-monoxide dehydrogenase medium subunit
MKAPRFELRIAGSLDEAIRILGQADGEGKVLAGGQSLVPLLNFRLARPEVLVDLNRLTELQGIRETGGELRIGAMTRQRQVERSALVARAVPLLCEALPLVAHGPIRNRGTIGGSLAHADPSAELCAASLALDARIVARGPNGERVIAAAEFFIGPFTTQLEPDEILTEVIFPFQAADGGSAIVEFARRRGDFAMAGVAAVLETGPGNQVAKARLSYIGVGTQPFRSLAAEETLTGGTPGDALFAEAAAAAAAGLHPGTDMHASGEYRRHLAEVLTRRALAVAYDRSTKKGTQ